MILREGPMRFRSDPIHKCKKPVEDHYEEGTVWGCNECRRRYTLRYSDTFHGLVRVRRFWPWPMWPCGPIEIEPDDDPPDGRAPY